MTTRLVLVATCLLFPAIVYGQSYSETPYARGYEPVPQQGAYAPQVAQDVQPAGWNDAGGAAGNPLRGVAPPMREAFRTAEAPTELRNTAPVVAPEATADHPSAEELQQQISAVAQAQIDEAERTELTQLLNKAMESLSKADQAKQRLAQFKADIESAPATIEAARQRSSQSLGKPQATAPETATVAELEKLAAEVELQLTAARQQLEAANQAADSKYRGERKAELTARMEAAVAKQQQIHDELRAGPLPNETPLRTTCRMMSLATRRETIRHQIAALEAERHREEALDEVHPLERDAAQRYSGWLERTVGIWHELIAARRKAELERQVTEARNKAQNAIPELRSFAQRNAELAEQRNELTTLLEKAAAELKTTNETLDSLKKDFERVSEKVEVGGMTAASGLLLRNRRDHLPHAQQYRQAIKSASA